MPTTPHTTPKTVTTPPAARATTPSGSGKATSTANSPTFTPQSTTNPGNSKGTTHTIVAATLGVVGALAFILIAWQLWRRRRASKSRNLPPPKPQVNMFDDNRRVSMYGQMMQHSSDPLPSATFPTHFASTSKNSSSRDLHTPVLSMAALDPRDPEWSGDYLTTQRQPPFSQFSDTPSPASSNEAFIPPPPSRPQREASGSNSGHSTMTSSQLRESKRLSTSSFKDHSKDGHRMSTHRGPPHSPAIKINLVMPEPLAPAPQQYNTVTRPSSRQSNHSQGGEDTWMAVHRTTSTSQLDAAVKRASVAGSVGEPRLPPSSFNLASSSGSIPRRTSSGGGQQRPLSTASPQ